LIGGSTANCLDYGPCGAPNTEMRVPNTNIARLIAGHVHFELIRN
jgi:hypothetical protein